APGLRREEGRAGAGGGGGGGGGAPRRRTGPHASASAPFAANARSTAGVTGQSSRSGRASAAAEPMADRAQTTLSRRRLTATQTGDQRRSSVGRSRRRRSN